ncbi:hypothetical protein IW261DRAFT_600853 [Armillaria novae-zelandiae]|uniref:MYND-type domain-containing protein n=1 Tax=Armillaria novae-zelandiae TaxID=153914 RepID=A0AA39UPI0_9AGAR|nr:hypothetical protein IW261DRAFT_600853 [Armillaria novae-zelandiae]
MGGQLNQQFVFKRQNGKVDFTRNIAEGCVHCLKHRKPEEPPMSLCGGCKRVRYCCKEHQRAHWRLHKSLCKAVQAEATSTDDYCIQQRRLVEDWVETHRYELIAMITSYIRRNPFDRKNDAFFVMLDTTNDASGKENPAVAFQVMGAPHVHKMGGMLEVEEAEAQDKAERPNDKIIGYFCCCFSIIKDGRPLPVFTAIQLIHEDETCPAVLAQGESWWTMMRDFSLAGAVFRMAPGKYGSWVPGMLIPKGKTWEWRRCVIEEIEARSGLNLGMYLD